MNSFAGSLGIVQRVLPQYRVAFFDRLASYCKDGLSLFAGRPRPSEAISYTEDLNVAQYSPAQNLHLLGGPLYLCWQRGLLPWLEKWDPHALIVEANPRYLSTSQAVAWMHKRGRPVIGWGLGAPFSGDILAGLRRARRKAFLKHFDGLIAYSKRGAEEYTGLGFPVENIFIAPNAVVSSPSGKIPQRAAGFKGQPTTLFVGRIQKRKGLDILLRACARLPKKQQPLILIVGDGPARREVEELASQIYPQAKFLGALYGAELESIFSKADLFVLPGTGGLAVQQAMAHGLPVLVAQGDGTQEDLVHSSNGWLVPDGDEKALTETLLEAFSNAVKLRQMGEDSFRLVKERYNLETMTEVFIHALNQVKV